MTAIRVTGDVIEFDGYVVGRISSLIPPTVRGRLEEALEGAVEPNEAIKAEEDKAVDDVFADVLSKAKEVAQAGMVEIGDLEVILRDMKKVCE